MARGLRLSKGERKAIKNCLAYEAFLDERERKQQKGEQDALDYMENAPVSQRLWDAAALIGDFD